ncbi:MAG: ComEC/Rec2 family competence protein [Flavitalea sp.]
MSISPFPFWKEAPFTRLLIPLITGILLQWRLKMPATVPWTAACLAFSGLLAYSFLRLSYQYRIRWINGVFIAVLLFSLGALLAHYKDSASLAAQTALFCKEQATITAIIEEPLSEKTASFKTTASISAIRRRDSIMHGGGKILIYFSKPKTGESPGKKPAYGDVIEFRKPLQPVKNFAAGSFNYRQYCAFAGIHFQVYLGNNEFLISGSNTNWLNNLLLNLRGWVIAVIRKNIDGKKEQGLAEALLIGYKDDLDKSLLQSYSNTGVVHVIAISGLHLGLIYALLRYLCAPLALWKKMRWLKPAIILSGLWLFSLLAGGAPSVLRSAVMFSCIVIGETISRNTSVFNNLSASAFFLLCYNPYWLWDTGFQLSYAALTGIVTFMKPVYRLTAFRNKMLDTVWQMNAVTIAAQVMTLPVTLFYFHQFPILFLFANGIAVPLSSLILMGELLLCAVSWWPAAAGLWGWILEEMIRWMNACMERLESVPFAVWKDLSISIEQALLLYAMVFTISGMFRQKTSG